MGVINTTPDSFSDGGLFLDPARAIEHGLELASEGASILDVGGRTRSSSTAGSTGAAPGRVLMPPT
ncbi:MAG: dihydropteroate synthase, partial [Planctomycetota bacterium]